MAYEIDFKFTPGTTVYVINRSTYSILKGVVVESKIKTFTRNDTLDDKIEYTVRIKSKKSVLHSNETTTFLTYLEAWTALYNVVAPTPTPTVSVTISVTPSPTPPATPDASVTPTPSVTPTMGVSVTPSPTPTPEPTVTPTATPTGAGDALLTQDGEPLLTQSGDPILV